MITDEQIELIAGLADSMEAIWENATEEVVAIRAALEDAKKYRHVVKESHRNYSDFRRDIWCVTFYGPSFDEAVAMELKSQ